MGPAKPSETHRWTGPGLGLAHHEPLGQVFGQDWNRTQRCLWYKPGLRAGFLDPLVTPLALFGNADFTGLLPDCWMPSCENCHCCQVYDLLLVPLLEHANRSEGQVDWVW